MHFLGHGVACVKFRTKNQLSSDFRNESTEIVKKFLYFYIVILKCYQTAIQYLGNVTLSLVLTSRHDKKLTRLGYHFVLRKASVFTGFWVNE